MVQARSAEHSIPISQLLDHRHNIIIFQPSISNLPLRIPGGQRSPPNGRKTPPEGLHGLRGLKA